MHADNTLSHTLTHTLPNPQVKHAKISKGMERVGTLAQNKSMRKHAQKKGEAEEAKLAAPSVISAATTAVKSSIWMPKNIVESEHRYL